MTESQDPWDGILTEGETILWQGQPNAGLRIYYLDIKAPVSAIFTIGFSIFWMALASQAGGMFWMFGLIFFGAGMYRLIGVQFWDAIKRRYTFYTLTNKRAFFATDIPILGKSLTSYRIEQDDAFELRAGKYDSVVFAVDRGSRRRGTFKTEVAFSRIKDARKVLGLLNSIQEGNI